MDLSPDTLEMLVHLMCAQARECLFEKAELQLKEESKEEEKEEEDEEQSEEKEKKKKKRKANRHLEMCLVIGQEASHVRRKREVLVLVYYIQRIGNIILKTRN